MINKEGKLFGKISIIDILVIIIFFAVVLGVYVRIFAPAKVAKTEMKDFTYTVKIEMLNQSSIDALLKEGVVYDSETGEKIGKISEISQPVPTMTTGVTNRGAAVETAYPDSYTVTVKIKTKGSVNEGEFYTENKKKIVFGEDIEFETKYISAEGTITEVSEK